MDNRGNNSQFFFEICKRGFWSSESVALSKHIHFYASVTSHLGHLVLSMSVSLFLLNNLGSDSCSGVMHMFI